jgi:HEAT repeat protein
MTTKERQLLIDLETREITPADFLQRFPVDVRTNADYVINEIQKAIETKDADEMELVMQLIWFSDDYSKYTNLLNRLLLIPQHRSHQNITKTLQDIKSPTSVPYIRKALESNFDYLEYTFSESDAIAKWFSWALAEIGTPEAIGVIKDFSTSADEGIRNEMQYRLKKIKQ